MEINVSYDNDDGDEERGWILGEQNTQVTVAEILDFEENAPLYGGVDK